MQPAGTRREIFHRPSWGSANPGPVEASRAGGWAAINTVSGRETAPAASGASGARGPQFERMQTRASARGSASSGSARGSSSGRGSSASTRPTTRAASTRSKGSVPPSASAPRFPGLEKRAQEEAAARARGSGVSRAPVAPVAPVAPGAPGAPRAPGASGPRQHSARSLRRGVVESDTTSQSERARSPARRPSKRTVSPPTPRAPKITLRLGPRGARPPPPPPHLLPLLPPHRRRVWSLRPPRGRACHTRLSRQATPSRVVCLGVPRGIPPLRGPRARRELAKSTRPLVFL